MTTITTQGPEQLVRSVSLTTEKLPGRGEFYTSLSIDAIVTHAAAILILNAEEQQSRGRIIEQRVAQLNDTRGLRDAANLSYQAYCSRATSRYLLGQNRLFGFNLQSDDLLVVDRAAGRGTTSVHVPAAEQAGSLVIGHQLRFALDSQPVGYPPLIYLTETMPNDDTPTGIEVGIRAERLSGLYAVTRADAQSMVQSVGQLTVPTGTAAYDLRRYAMRQ
jgi:hypothetical protein